jgi:hypothetical protein
MPCHALLRVGRTPAAADLAALSAESGSLRRRMISPATTSGSSAEPPAATQRVEEVFDVEDPVLEQVAEVPVGHQLDRVPGLQVLGLQHDAEPGSASRRVRAARAPSSVRSGGMRMSDDRESRRSGSVVRSLGADPAGRPSGLACRTRPCTKAVGRQCHFVKPASSGSRSPIQTAKPAPSPW